MTRPKRFWSTKGSNHRENVRICLLSSGVANVTESECELPEQFWDEASREGLLYHLEGETQLRKHDALPRNFSFKSQPKLEPPWWQRDVSFLPPQKQARALEAIQQFIYQCHEVTTKAHMSKVIYAAYSQPIFSALNAFDKLQLGRYAPGHFSQAQRDAIFPNAPVFGLSFNEERLDLQTRFAGAVLMSQGLSYPDPAIESKYPEATDAQIENAESEWEKLEAWQSETQRLANLLRTCQEDKKNGRPETAYLRYELIRLLKGSTKLTNKERLDRELFYFWAERWLEQFQKTDEFAKFWGLTKCTEDEALKACEKHFQKWLTDQGTAWDPEPAAMLARVLAFLEQHGDSRFTDWDNDANRVTINRMGFKKTDDSGTEYYLLTEGREVLTDDECDQVIQNLAVSFKTYVTSLPLDKVLERAVAVAIAKTLDVS